jgi:beta-glucosidase
MSKQFPDSFVWGVATSAFQIEGATSADGRGTSIWDTFCRTPGKVFEGHTGDIACEHYHHWQSDLDLIAELGVDAYRFSIAWPRILADGAGQVNAKGLDFYERLVDGMLRRGLKPYCTLYHWDLPQALDDKGGWLSRDTAMAFAEYAEVVTKRLGDRVVSYATLNEPWCSAYLGYGNGHHAPGHADLKESFQAAHHLLLAHGLALPVMRENAPGAEHGIVLNLSQVYPETDSPEDTEAARRFDRLNNLWYLGPLFEGRYPEDVWQQLGALVPEVADGDLAIINRPIDFLGENYYTPTFVQHQAGDYPNISFVRHDAAEHTAMDWEVYPQGLRDLLLRLHRDYGVPLYVTENGAAYADTIVADGVHDSARTAYFQGHLAAVAEAVSAGADVRGYFAWSLMDNFEWAFGYDRRFGIVYVDFETQVRTLKDSAKWYQKFVRQQREAVSAVGG